VVYYTIFKGIYDVDTMNKSGLRKSSMEREKKRMNKSRDYWGIILTPSYPAPSQSR